jgi:RimJ/RimL family protein N-acetyltransferase
MTATDPPWYPIRTKRLLIRDFRAEDADDVHLYAADPEVARFMPWGPNTTDETAAFVGRALDAQATWPRLDHGFAMELRETGRVVGSIGFHLRDVESRTVEIGYCLRRDCWGQGLTSEAAAGMLAAAFGRLRLHRVFATCDVRNTGSYRVMEAVGMRREGEFRQDRVVKGALRDTYLYAILADEFDRAQARA